jgi:hypothetical protein
MRYLCSPGICRDVDVGAAIPRGVHAPTDIFSYITGERGGKRFRPSETGRGWIGLTDLNYRIIRQKYQNLTPACFAAL